MRCWHLLAPLLALAHAYPLIYPHVQAQLSEEAVEEEAEALEPEVDALEPGSPPCHEHRPLPPVDPVAGLSWLSHARLDCLRSVNLGWEGVTDADVPKLVRLVDAGVREIRLYQNALTDEGASQLAHAMKNTAITEVDLAHNLIGDAGVAALADALPSIPELRLLKLNNNRGVADSGVRAFARALASGALEASALNELWLSSPQVSVEARAELRTAWELSGREARSLHQ